MAVKIQCKKRDDKVLFRASMCCSFLLHYTVIIVALDFFALEFIHSESCNNVVNSAKW